MYCPIYSIISFVIPFIGFIIRFVHFVFFTVLFIFVFCIDVVVIIVNITIDVTIAIISIFGDRFVVDFYKRELYFVICKGLTWLYIARARQSRGPLKIP